MKYKITAEVIADSPSDALKEVGYRIYTHERFYSIKERLENLEIEEIDEKT